MKENCRNHISQRKSFCKAIISWKQIFNRPLTFSIFNEIDRSWFSYDDTAFDDCNCDVGDDDAEDIFIESQPRVSVAEVKREECRINSVKGFKGGAVGTRHIKCYHIEPAFAFLFYYYTMLLIQFIYGTVYHIQCGGSHIYKYSVESVLLILLII